MPRRARPRAAPIHGDLRGDGLVYNSWIDAWVPSDRFDARKELRRWAGENARAPDSRRDTPNVCATLMRAIVAGTITPK